MTRTTILSLRDPVVSLYSAYPLFHAKRNRFRITNEAAEARKEGGDALILVHWFGDGDRRSLEEKKEELLGLRERYKKIAFFDTDDSASTNLTFVLPYVDRYWKKQIYKDRSEYLRPHFGNRLFADYYHKKFGVDELWEPYPEFGPAENLSKLRLTWNLGIGSYPVRYRNEKISSLLYDFLGPRASVWPFRRPVRAPGTVKKINRCHARFSDRKYTPTIAYQRTLFGQILDDKHEALRGLVKRRLYEKDMHSLLAVLSPFGWGEVCFRDFEAIQNNAILIKPDMSHLETWPDIYLPEQSYIPVAWDGNDLVQKVRTALDFPPQEVARITDMAWGIWNDAFGALQRRVDELLEDLLD